MWRIILFGWLMTWLLACNQLPAKTQVEPGTGRLVPYSKQVSDIPKMIIFIPGCVETIDPNGLNPTELENYFSIKLGNFEQLGAEMFGAPTSQLAEYWFLGYYPSQDIAEIAASAKQLMADNRHFTTNCRVAVVAHSEGAVVGWLLDQRYQALAGGVLLGGPILSTPIADKPVRDEAVKRTFPLMSGKLVPVFDRLAIGTEQLAVSYPESGLSHGEFKLVAGRIKAPSAGFWSRNINLLDALLAERGFIGGIQDNRQFAELGATIISQAKWREQSANDRQSDGLVPVSSATLEGDAPYSQVLDGYDHWDLVTGKGDLTLDRLTLEWLDRVLQLRPNWVETDLPATPDLIELPTEVGDVFSWVKFAYINDKSHLVLADANWEREYQLPVGGVHSHPQFNDSGDSLVLGLADGGVSNLFVLTGSGAQQVTFDGASHDPAWSPNERWLAYQSGSDLVIHQLDSNERMVAASSINVVAPPVWTVAGLSGRLYFVNTQRELRWVSPRERESTTTNLVQTGCYQPFLVEGLVGGMIVISGEPESGRQMVTVVTGPLAKHLSVELIYDPARWNVSQDGTDIALTLDQAFDFQEVAYDPEYNHLYLVGSCGQTAGIYLFDIQALLDCTKPQPSLSDFWQLIRPLGSQLAIRPVR